MNNNELVFFGQTWKCIGNDAQDMIDRIVDASNLDSELPEYLLEDLDVKDLERAREELSCCNVPSLVRLVDDAVTQANEHHYQKNREKRGV